jgi:uncharacterized protein (DUF1697 family)
MSQVALFRNLNLGHPGSPTGEELVAAFAGTALARNFQTNGTVIFSSDDPEATVGEALRVLRGNGYHHGLVVRPLSELERVVKETPAADPAENVYRTMISFYDIDRLPAVELPLRSRDQLVELRRLDRRSAGSVCWKPRRTAGDVTGFLEGLLKVPVTTRTLGTLERLVTAAGRSRPAAPDACPPPPPGPPVP